MKDNIINGILIFLGILSGFFIFIGYAMVYVSVPSFIVLLALKIFSVGNLSWLQVFLIPVALFFGGIIMFLVNFALSYLSFSKVK